MLMLRTGREGGGISLGLRGAAEETHCPLVATHISQTVPAGPHTHTHTHNQIKKGINSDPEGGLEVISPVRDKRNIRGRKTFVIIMSPLSSAGDL